MLSGDLDGFIEKIRWQEHLLFDRKTGKTSKKWTLGTNELNKIQQLGDDEKENFQKFGEFYSSSIIESDEQKRRIKKQLLNIKNQGLDTVINLKNNF